MLNRNNERELAYLVRVDSIRPIEGADRCEVAVIGGWTVMVHKGEFQPGSLGIYFEIDSRVPATPEFDFMAKRDYKVKTQKFFKGVILSQGLLMTPADFGWEVHIDADGTPYCIEGNNIHFPNNDTRFLTKTLGVIYAEPGDNTRKATIDPYEKMKMRHRKLFKKWPFYQMMKHEAGRKFLFFFFGKKKEKKREWPSWVEKTDEERVQNIPQMPKSEAYWMATEKIDGTSTTFTMKRGPFNRKKFYVCSRNVVFDKPGKQCFYDTNVYLEMAEKYHAEEILSSILDLYPKMKWVTIQGETYGEGVQNRTYSLKGHAFRAFNLITDVEGRWDSERAANFLQNRYNMPWVPLLGKVHFEDNSTVDDVLDMATDKSVIDGGMREGLVFRSLDGKKSFKAVSNEYLLKYHG